MICEPRSAIRLVTLEKALRPKSVKLKLTFGAFVFGSVPAFGSVMSLPESSESSSST